MNLIQRLQETRDETLEYYALADADLAKSYAPGKWSVRFILTHLADTETVFYDRIRRILSEPRQVLWAMDQDGWARGLDYASVPVQVSARIFEAVRAGVIHQAGLHYERDGQLEFIHSLTGVRTLRDEFDKVANHNAHHLEQIRTALGRSPGG